MFITTTDGTRLAYEDYGQGAPIVFAHSAMLSSDMWEYQVPFFVERGFRCILMDRRGHGRSDRPSSGYDLDTGADDLAVLIEHLDLHDVTLVGHSTGGAEIARYLDRHGEERIARAAFVSAILPFVQQTDDNPDGVPEAALDAMLGQIRADRATWLADQSQLYFATHLGNDVSPAYVDWTLRTCLATSPWAVLRLQEAVFRYDHRASLARITVPTMAIHGDADFSAPVDVTGRRTAECVPGTDYREYAGAGHGLYFTHRDQLNEDLLELTKR